MVVIVNFVHCSDYRPSVLFVGLVLIAPLLAKYYLFLKVCHYLVSCLGEMLGCAGMVQYAGPTMSQAVALRFSILGFLI